MHMSEDSIKAAYTRLTLATNLAMKDQACGNLVDRETVRELADILIKIIDNLPANQQITQKELRLYAEGAKGEYCTEPCAASSQPRINRYQDFPRIFS